MVYPSSMRRGSSMYSLTCDGVSECREARNRRAAYLDEESDSLAAVQETVVVSEGEVHHLFPSIRMIWSGHELPPEVGEKSLTGRISTLPFTATGLSLMAWRPRTAVSRVSTGERQDERTGNLPVWGRLMMGVPIKEPKTPPWPSQHSPRASTGKRTYVADGESTAGHVLDGQLVVASLKAD